MAKKILQKDLISELGLENLPEDERNKLMAEAAETINTQISLRLREELSDKDLEEFDRLWDEGGEEEINSYISAKVPQLDKIVEEEIAEFKQSLMDTADWVRNEVLSDDNQAK